MREPRPGYLFRGRECPNRPHPKPMTGRCGLCGEDVRAYRIGYRLAPWMSLLVFAVVTSAVLALLLGCAPKPESPEDHYLASVRDAATANAVIWTDALEEDARNLGAAVCRDLEAGKPMAQVREETAQDDERSQAVIQAAVSAAAVHLCPGASQ